MPTRWIPYVKVLVHAVCLLPFLKLIMLYRSGTLGLMADPVLYITLLTGYWTLYLLITSLAVTPVRRLHPKLGNLIRFRRLLGLYAFFYATLHFLIYVIADRFAGLGLPAHHVHLHFDRDQRLHRPVMQLPRKARALGCSRPPSQAVKKINVVHSRTDLAD